MSKRSKRSKSKGERVRRAKKPCAWKKAIKESQDYICPVCGKIGTDETLNIHHCLPKAKKGRSTPENCVAVHVTCHRWIHKTFGLRFYDPRMNNGSSLKYD